MASEESYIGIDFIGMLHQPLNMQGAIRLDVAIQDIINDSDREHIVIIENGGRPSTEAHKWLNRYRYQGFTKVMVESRLHELLRRKPADREIQINTDQLAGSLADRDIERFFGHPLLHPERFTPFDIISSLAFDKLRGNRRIRFELESHSNEVSKAETQEFDKYTKLARNTGECWLNHRYGAFLDNAKDAYPHIFQCMDTRDDDIAKQYIPRVEQTAQSPQRVTFHFIFGKGHRMGEYILNGLSPLAQSKVALTDDRGESERIYELELIRKIRGGDLLDPTMYGKYFMVEYAMHALTHYFAKLGGFSDFADKFAYKYEDFQIATSDVVGGLTEHDMRDICEQGVPLEIPDLITQGEPIAVQI